MRQPLFKKHSDINEKRIAFIEKVVTRIARRSQSTAVAMITPYPISNAVFGEDVKGVILRYMFPCSGTITKGLVVLGKKPKKGVGIEVKITDSVHAEAKSYIISRRDLLMEPKLEVDSGCKLEISIDSIDDKVEEVWVSFLWKPSVKNIEKESFLIDDLEKGLLKLEEEIA